MTPEKLARDVLPLVPYKRHGRDLQGMDCFGLVETWFRELHGIEIDDREAQTSDPAGFSNGYSLKSKWNPLEAPVDHCVVVMKSLMGRQIIREGHCGIYWNGLVIHTDEGTGFQAIPITDPSIKRKITDLRIHEAI